MYINFMTTENWVDGDDEGEIIEGNIKLDIIKQAILDMNGNNKTCVMLSPKEDSEESLTIGGGFNGQYILTITYDNEKFYTLMDSTKDSNSYIEMTVAVQTSKHPANICVGLGKVIRAVEHYAKTGELLKDLEWKTD
jgi:hypothetical protein